MGKKERLKSFQQPANEPGKLPAYIAELLELASPTPFTPSRPRPSPSHDVAPTIHPALTKV